jgi:hypothetical protein
MGPTTADVTLSIRSQVVETPRKAGMGWAPDLGAYLRVTSTGEAPACDRQDNFPLPHLGKAQWVRHRCGLQSRRPDSGPRYAAAPKFLPDQLAASPLASQVVIRNDGSWIGPAGRP